MAQKYIWKINPGGGGSDPALTSRVAAIEKKLAAAAKDGIYSAVQVTSGVVTQGGTLIEVGSSGQTTPSDSLVAGGIFFEEITS